MKKKKSMKSWKSVFFNRFVILVKTTFVASKKWHLLVVIILVIVLFVLGIDINSAGLLSLDKNRFNGSVFLSFFSNDHFIRVVGDGFGRHSESSFWCEIRTHHNSHGGMVKNVYKNCSLSLNSGDGCVFTFFKKISAKKINLAIPRLSNSIFGFSPSLVASTRPSTLAWSAVLNSADAQVAYSTVYNKIQFFYKKNRDFLVFFLIS